MLKVLVTFGTRPEAIKLAPVILEMQRRADIRPVVCVTGQHRQMLDQVLTLFDIKPDYDMKVMETNQRLSDLTARVVQSFTAVMDEAKPDWVLVQGDTTSAMAASLAAFYQKVPVGHVEAGLRTGNRYSPFPEEINRRLVSVVTTYHFAPTVTARDALLREGTDPATVFLTGNTIVDAVRWITTRAGVRAQGLVAPGNRLLLVTAHRRENFGEPLRNICHGLKALVQYHHDVEIVYPVHLNPNVQGPVREILGNVERVHLLDPLPYDEFASLLAQAYLILTDSGGVQEEATALGKPVLVMRQETERPEAVTAGNAKVIGTDKDTVVAEAGRLLDRPDIRDGMAIPHDVFGDGQAARRIVDALMEKASARPGAAHVQGRDSGTQ